MKSKLNGIAYGSYEGMGRNKRAVKVASVEFSSHK
jgi:hypothetical protein